MSASPELLITKEFLEEIFKPQNVVDFSIQAGTKPGDNYLSTIYSVRTILKDNYKHDKTIEKHIIVKCYPENEAKREFLESVSLFATEYLVYQELLPALNELVKEANKVEQLFVINAAKFYGGNIVGRNLTTLGCEPWTKENLIILEDIRVRGHGFRMLNRRKGLGLQHCFLTIKQLANLHAFSWVYKKRNKLDFLVNKHPYLKDAMYRIENEAGWRPVVEGMNRNALKVVQQEFGKTSEIWKRLSNLLSKDVMAIIRMFLSEKGVNEEETEKLLRVPPEDAQDNGGEPWIVATHGDCWINNLLFSFDHPNSQNFDPTDVALVDFQAFREACLTTDLAYFLYSSTPVSLRKEYVDLILETYYKRFVKICSILNEELPKGFTWDNFLRRWRRARIYALLMSIQFITFIFKEDSKVETDEKSSTEGVGNANSIENAYADVKCADNNLDWRNAIIQTVLLEYEDGIL